MKTYFYRLFGLCSLLVLNSCVELEPSAPEEYQLLDGPIEGLTFAEARRHLAGDVAFNDRIFTEATGLGPLFVATSCGSCHAGDGKGHPFTTLTRFGINDSLGSNEFDHGPQLQNRALPGYKPEVIPAAAPFSRFTPPITTGLGYLELVSEADILAMEAANINNPNGVRGHPNWAAIPSYVTPRKGSAKKGDRYISRFGKKGAAYDLLHQTVFAYNQDMGITSSFDPSDVYTLQDLDPEISDKEIHDVVFYLQTLKAPIQRDQNAPDVVAGKKTFASIGCVDCHKPALKTGYSPIGALSFKEFYPYTDLLVHDMGEALNDGYTEGSALPGEWRTPPLWGLGLAPDSQGGQFYLMHDGRAKSIEEAILLHGGEGTSSKNKYGNLTAEERRKLITFLKSL
ncbi:di-heme oxidoredictase family protein [Flavobacterium sp. TAB 87]|uniref:di-heme oxidoredictase family protein n=1 Tax=Flavobacterium sp. TAB 87 TaxID=1729581 RepID=UPI00076DE896|nr:di-heme oxidoredictase family protein [Flavobacterium sp. TAB 87]KVV15433.1 cytochrome c oxidase, cbb3-type, subunit III [Flavobacterium sp. TAB 87]